MAIENVATTLSVMGGKWKPLILCQLFKKPRRFTELQTIPGVTPKVLTQQLRELEQEGLVQRIVVQVVPPHVEYRMTDYGATLCPVLRAMGQWGEKHEQRLNKMGS
ncbi:helix-turn-helix domain-containing protein [uncultured Desulfuromonas sp.]|uniref:winged helix-turn-helix transcriptional regulator n=1 Tax=uncultured Desulfuromonas sp. TaxID=181013 RepID=UPI002AAC27FB|nr:helix-turn-helix domain-containing protein [uncultured Desulfuromonas sp.]